MWLIPEGSGPVKLLLNAERNARRGEALAGITNSPMKKFRLMSSEWSSGRLKMVELGKVPENALQEMLSVEREGRREKAWSGRVPERFRLEMSRLTTEPDKLQVTPIQAQGEVVDGAGLSLV